MFTVQVVALVSKPGCSESLWQHSTTRGTLCPLHPYMFAALWRLPSGKRTTMAAERAHVSCLCHFPAGCCGATPSGGPSRASPSTSSGGCRCDLDFLFANQFCLNIYIYNPPFWCETSARPVACSRRPAQHVGTASISNIIPQVHAGQSAGRVSDQAVPCAAHSSTGSHPLITSSAPSDDLALGTSALFLSPQG